MHLDRTVAASLALAFVIVALPAAAVGTERWTLAEVVANALAEHPLLVASRERIVAARGTLADSGRWPNPSLVFSGENLRLGDEDFALWTEPDWFLYVTQRLETADKRGHRQRAAEQGVNLAAIEQQILERALVHRIKVAYQEVLTAQDKFALVRDSRDRLDELVELNRVRAVEGYAPEGDYIQSRLELERFDHAVRRSELELRQSKVRMLQALAFTEFDTDFELAPPALQLGAPIDEAALVVAVRELPEIRAAEAAVAEASSRAELQEALAHPDLTASVGYKRNGPDDTLLIGLSLPLPVFDRNQGGILRGRAELAAAEAELRVQESRALGELEASLEAVRVTRRQIESLTTDFIGRADESRAVALAAYREGAAALLVVLEAERTRNAAQELVVEAIHDYQVALYGLERAAGVDSLPRRSGVLGGAP